MSLPPFLPPSLPPSLPTYLHPNHQVPNDQVGGTCTVAPPKRLPSFDPSNRPLVPPSSHSHANPGLNLLQSSFPGGREGGREEGREEERKREGGKMTEGRVSHGHTNPGLHLLIMGFPGGTKGQKEEWREGKVKEIIFARWQRAVENGYEGRWHSSIPFLQ